MFESQAKPDNFRLLVAVYTCDVDDHLLDEFYSSTVMKMLEQRENTEIIEVRADESIQRDEFKNARLTVKTAEHYNNLPRKTFSMISHLANQFEFDYLVKIDVTTLTKVIKEKLLTGGKQVSEAEFLRCFSDHEFYCDYNGYVELHAKRKGAENWADKKGITIGYDQVFDSDQLPLFYSGKMWLISREFATYIGTQGGPIVDKFSKHFPAEDVMVGTLYQKFLVYKESSARPTTLLARLLKLIKLD